MITYKHNRSIATSSMGEKQPNLIGHRIKQMLFKRNNLKEKKIKSINNKK